MKLTNEVLGIPPERQEFYDKLAEQLERHEGRENYLYEDSEGHLTIGVGHLMSEGLPDIVIDVLFLHDMKEKAVAELDRVYPDWIDLDETRQLVLADMMFNLGAGKFMGFHKFWKAILRQDYDRAADEMLDSRWRRQVGRRAETLAEMMRGGDERTGLGE